MGERAQKVVVRDGSVSLYFTRWGGQDCVEALADGIAGLHGDLEISELTDQMLDPDFAEGGYLIDFDHRRILIYSWHDNFLEQIQPRIAAAWPEWSVQAVPEGVPDFRSHLSFFGLPTGEPAA